MSIATAFAVATGSQAHFEMVPAPHESRVRNHGFSTVLQQHHYSLWLFLVDYTFPPRHNFPSRLCSEFPAVRELTPRERTAQQEKT